jgi:hypothetical protein
MRVQYWPLLFTVVAADLQYWLDRQLRGHDFDFKATYPSGLTLSTEDKSRGVLDYQEIIDLTPQIQVKGLNEEARKKRYIAFSVVWYLTYLGVDDVIMAFPWVGANLTVLTNGTLSWDNPDSSTSSGSPSADGSEVRNGTMHVWEHTQELDNWLNHNEADGYPMPMWWNIARVWTNGTSKVSAEFERANIDFKFQNKEGTKRCDVSETGAPIPGKERGDETSCVQSPTPKTGDTEDNEGKNDGGDDNHSNNSTGNEGSDEKEDPGSAGTMFAVNWLFAGLLMSCSVAAHMF